MKGPLSISPSRSAALFVDLQEEQRQDARYVVAGFDALIDNVMRLQNAARAKDIGVFHSAYVVDTAAGVGRPFHPLMPDGRSAFSDVADPLSAICPEVAPTGEEVVFVKTDASAFSSGAAAKTLKARGIEWLFVAGVWTEACIAETVRDAISHGFRVLLVKDACSSGTHAMHQTAVLNLANRLYGGAIVDTDAACTLMAGASADAWRVPGSVPLRFNFEDAADLYAGL